MQCTAEPNDNSDFYVSPAPGVLQSASSSHCYSGQKKHHDLTLAPLLPPAAKINSPADLSSVVSFLK